MEPLGSLKLCFYPVFTFGYFNNDSGIPNYVVPRNEPGQLHQVYEHIQKSLRRGKSSFALLPIALCAMQSREGERETRDEHYRKLLLVSDEIWKTFVSSYSVDYVKVVLEKRPTITPPSLSGSCYPYRPKELKALDVHGYFSGDLERVKLAQLSKVIFNDDIHVKDSLRRGVWMHLLEIFHPDLKTQNERADYIDKLRKVYHTMKNKLFSERESWSHDKRHLHDSIYRDAVRTDPSESFVTNDFIDKLVTIVMIYTLEHHGVVKYTQGMTDLLSPLLYVMKKEEDAYICFAAMFKRIHDNFGEWCDGALNKLERLRHLCEVLDPPLYYHLHNGQSGDDPFILFFGMLLIECRREFSFQETLHLLEVMWSAAFPRQEGTGISHSKWASFMTSASCDLVKEVFNEIESPYAAEPLRSLSLTLPPTARERGSTTTTTPTTSEPVDIPSPSHNIIYANNETVPQLSSPTLSQGVRDRSLSLPDSKEYIIIETEDAPTLQVTKSEGDLPLEEEERNDIVNELESSLVHSMNKRLKGLPSNNEMSDLSSLSSANTVSSNGLARLNEGAFPSPNVPRHKSPVPQVTEPSHDKEDEVAEEEDGNEIETFNLEVSVTVRGPPKGAENETDEPTTVIPTYAQNPADSDDSAASPVKSKERESPQKKSHTLPREKRRFEDSEVSAYGLESSSLRRIPSPSYYLIHQLSCGMSSPYVSGINVRGLKRDRNGGGKLDSGPLLQSLSGGESRRLLTMRRRGSMGEYSPFPSRSRSGSFNAPATPTDGVDEIERGGEEERGSLIASLTEDDGVLSQLASIERARPSVNLQSSLSVKMSDSFSLFVCLAILLSHRGTILSREIDFVSLSLILSSDSADLSLTPILQTAHELHTLYYHYLMMTGSTGETWLDDMKEFSSEIVPIATPPRSPVDVYTGSTTSCSINF